MRSDHTLLHEQFDPALTRKSFRAWGDMALSPQQKRLWKHLIDGKDCTITVLFRSAQTTYETIDPRHQHQFVGMLIYRINQKLDGSGYQIRCGERRYSYRLSEAEE